jgi:hypothetical protein
MKIGYFPVVSLWYNNLKNGYVYGSNIAGTIYVTTIGGELLKRRYRIGIHLG